VSKVTGLLFGPKIDTSTKGVVIDRELKTEEIVARAQELGGAAKADAPVTPGAATTSNAPDTRPRRTTGSATQDVEVKAGSTPSTSNKKDANKKDKNKKENDKKKDNDGAAKVLRNP
jgi:hypothetical protein